MTLMTARGERGGGGTKRRRNVRFVFFCGQKKRRGGDTASDDDDVGLNEFYLGEGLPSPIWAARRARERRR
jgi:hypothetical protein